MGVFISNAITDRGRILLGEAQVGATFEATRIVMGSGYIPAGYTARTMTAVVAPVIELAINKKRRAGDGTVTFGGVYSNENITEAFYFREFALYARVEYADGTYSDEVLYSYGNAGDNADLMPAYSTSTVVEKQMDLVTWVGNETAVNLSVVSGIYNPHAEKHAADGEDPILPELIGAEKVMGVVNEDDLFVWVDKQTTGGSFLIAPDRTTKNIPTASVSWFIGHLDYNISGKRITMTELNTLRTWVNVTRENIFTGWFELANLADVIRKAGDEVNGELYFKNLNEYYMLKKGRTLPNGKTHFLTMGLSSGGSTTLEHYTRDDKTFDGTGLDGRLELGQVSGANGWLNPYALVLRGDNANGPTYRIYGEHFSPAVTATAELV